MCRSTARVPDPRRLKRSCDVPLPLLSPHAEEQSDEPRDEEHDGHDPQDMQCETQSGKQQDHEQQDDNEYHDLGIPLPMVFNPRSDLYPWGASFEGPWCLRTWRGDLSATAHRRG
jgi:hypothetical protein